MVFHREICFGNASLLHLLLIVQLMKEGAKWELYIPSDLAYGEVGAGGAIPPGAALVFQMEILQVHDEEVRIGRQKYPMEGQR